MSVNKAILVGRLGKDPEIRVTGSGLTVAAFPLATGHTAKKGGQRVQETEWHRIVAYERLAELCRDYLSRGRLIYAEGRLKTSTWEDKAGSRHSKTEIIAEKIQFLGGNGEQAGSGRADGEAEGFAGDNLPGWEEKVPF